MGLPGKGRRVRVVRSPEHEPVTVPEPAVEPVREPEVAPDREPVKV